MIQMKRRSQLNRTRPKGNLEPISPAGINFFSKINSKEPSGSVGSNIPAKFKLTPFPTFSKAMTFFAKLNQVWEKQLCL